VDITTLVTVVLINASLDSVIFLIVWRAQPTWRGLGGLAIGYSSLTLGLALLAASSVLPWPVLVLAANLLINASMFLVPDGLAAFLGVARRRWLGLSFLAFTVLFWPLALALAPDNASIRIIASSAIQMIMFAHMVRSVAVSRIQPRGLRWTMGAFLSAHIAFAGARATDAALRLDQIDIFRGGPMEALFFFEFNLILTFLFLALLLMVGFRLTADLSQRNAALVNELDRRHRLQAELAAALEVETELRREQRQFVSLVSHEFRTPLAVIDRAAEFMMTLLPEAVEPVTDRLDRIRGAVARLVHMIDQLLAFERLDQSSLRRVRLDLREVMAEAASHAEGLGAAGRVLLRLPEGALPLCADREMLVSIIGNLVDNGLKYSPPDTQVMVEVRVADGFLVIEISDRGAGIPAVELKSVGTRFFRASTARHVTGTGLGLHTVRRLVDLHGGQFRLTSGAGQGTTATVYLPQGGTGP
jgi:signal transduction histidine kinase